MSNAKRRVTFKKTCMFILIFAATICYSAQTGNDLLHGCIAIIKADNGEELTPDEAPMSIYWLGYISGYVDSKVLQELYAGKKGPYCFPEKGIENQQIARVVVKFLKKNPERLHESARVLLSGALIGYFPCKK